MEDFGQLIFLVIAAIIWIVGEAARARREKAEREGTPPPAEQRRAPTDTQRRAPTDTQRQAPSKPRERARVVLEDILGLPRRDAPPDAEPRPKKLETPEPQEPSSPQFPNRLPESGRAEEFVVAAYAQDVGTLTVSTSSVRRAAALRRLGVAPGTSGREATRRAILWSEVLGPPRTRRGPHRHRAPITRA